MADKRNMPGRGPKFPHELMPEVATDRPDAELSAAIDKVLAAATEYEKLVASRVNPGDVDLKGCQLAAGVLSNAVHAIGAWKNDGEPRPLVEFGVAINALEAARAGFAAVGRDELSSPAGTDSLSETIDTATDVDGTAGQWARMLSELEQDNKERSPEAAKLIEGFKEYVETFFDDEKDLSGDKFADKADVECKGRKAVIALSTVLAVTAAAVKALTEKNDASILLTLLNMTYSIGLMVRARTATDNDDAACE